MAQQIPGTPSCCIVSDRHKNYCLSALFQSKIQVFCFKDFSTHCFEIMKDTESSMYLSYQKTINIHALFVFVFCLCYFWMVSIVYIFTYLTGICQFSFCLNVFCLKAKVWQLFFRCISLHMSILIELICGVKNIYLLKVL